MYAPFFIRFLLSTLTLSILIAVILLAKKVFKKHISAKYQYNIGFILLIMLIIPFVPLKYINLGNVFNYLYTFNQLGSSTNRTSMIKNSPNSIINNSNALNDFSVSLNQVNFDSLNILLLISWIIGILIMIAITIHCNIKIKNMKKSIQILRDEEIVFIFEKCKKDIGINKDFILCKSPIINTPITFGYFKPHIILPDKSISKLSLKDIKYILLHELQHFKNKDILINYIMCFLQILYWFNPLVWYAFKEMRIDREIACDISVLKKLDKDSHIEYGQTLINFVDNISRPSNLTLTSDIGGSKKQIKKRLLKIMDFHNESNTLKFKSILIFTLIALIVFGNIPKLSIMADINEKYRPTNEQTVYEDLSQYFKGFDGSFVMYDLKSKQYHIYNKEKSKTRISPNSTYKIYSALLGLENGIITRNNSHIPWDGKHHSNSSWNEDQDLFSAMENSVNWYFQTLDKKTGLKNIQTYLKQIGYGNYDVSGGISNFWLESSLKISPIEQVELLESFYTNKFKFEDKNIETVKDSLLISKKEGVSLFGKTGTANINGKDVNGWFIGYVEKNENTYFFATNIQSKDYSNGSSASKITLSILNDKKIYNP
ncbi:TPA: BlaR1 family beta-lactam sensor/signal transducer [Clostridioides difficile]|nr:BlaR1 family beta-lactam sensor/signal transducer [Clostridioides difficile]